MKRSPLPWAALKPYQDTATENYYDPEDSDLERAYTRIIGSDGEAVINAHDCFEFNPGDAEFIVRAVNCHYELINMVEDLYNNLSKEARLSFTEVHELLKKAKGQ